MSTSLSQSTVSSKAASPAAPVSPWSFVLFPAVAMMLGWGLRGYIGGGPFAAMIPGAFVALSLSLLLGHDRQTAAMAALFGAVAIGYGGEMTYGQTLGLACNPETMGWGLLGVTIKGAVWGLLGGAVLGVGLTFRQYKKSALVVAFVLTIVLLFVGWKLINEPRLIYFSDPVNRPREELWAGLLFSALGFLAFIHWKGQGKQARVPLYFALWGALSGGIGFGGGTLFLVYGPELPLPQQWFGWWKAMEFFFGFALGAGIGIAAWRHRDILKAPPADATYLPDRRLSAAALVMVVVLFFLLFPVLEEYLGNVSSGQAGNGALVAYNVFRPLYTFVFFGAVCIFLGLYSITAAWHVAITITFFHTAIDLNRNMHDTIGTDLPGWGQVLLVVVLTGGFACAVQHLQVRQRAIPLLYLLLLWACFVMATLRAFVYKDYFFSAEGAAGIHLPTLPPSTWTVYGTFLVTTLITALCIRRFARRGNDQGD